MPGVNTSIRDTPSSTEHLRDWVQEELHLEPTRASELITRVEAVVARQRQLVEESKHDAIRALSEGFAAKLERLQRQLSEKDVTVSNIARYFEEVVADLTEKSHRDPKTKLLNFDWFMARVESFLAVEKRVRWCGVGVVDINSFKWYNDTLGHAVGDRIILRVAQILREQVRSDDVLAQERPSKNTRDLHARFGGDEFCFLIPELAEPQQAYAVGERFRSAVERYDWRLEDERLAVKPVRVDVGVVCLQLGRVADRRLAARRIADALIQRADELMYEAKGLHDGQVHFLRVRLEAGVLIEITEEPATSPAL
jgi:diguanylate cyclase (GGDEF)-like protein